MSFTACDFCLLSLHTCYPYFLDGQFWVIQCHPIQNSLFFCLKLKCIWSKQFFAQICNISCPYSRISKEISSKGKYKGFFAIQSCVERQQLCLRRRHESRAVLFYQVNLCSYTINVGGSIAVILSKTLNQIRKLQYYVVCGLWDSIQGKENCTTAKHPMKDTDVLSTGVVSTE